MVNVPLAAAAVVLMLRAGDAGERRTKGPIDIPGAVLLALAIGAGVYGLSEGQTAGWGSTSVLASLVAGLVLFGLFVAIELHSRTPLLEFGLLRHLNSSPRPSASSSPGWSSWVSAISCRTCYCW